MQFRIPQFIDIEDKVFGPFTFKQFGYLLGAIAFAYIFWKLIPYKIISIIFILLFSGTFLALAFVKINSRPFADVLESAYKFVIGNKIFIWQKNNVEEDLSKIQAIRERELAKRNKEKTPAKNITVEKLKELSGRLDILDAKERKEVNLREEILKRSGKYQI
ncbi:MAG: hypothetical protein RI945_383 [Candidatus Parcubacteria bacterium]|jgi:hypothetical protein